MDIFTILGILFIIIVAFIIGMIVGNYLKTIGIERAGYKIFHDPTGHREYIIIDKLVDTNVVPQADPYQQLFRQN